MERVYGRVSRLGINYSRMFPKPIRRVLESSAGCIGCGFSGMTERRYCSIGLALVVALQLFGCNRSTADIEAGDYPEPRACSECRPAKSAARASAEAITDVFSFGGWQAILSDDGGRCKVKLQAYGEHPAVVEKTLDLEGPCYVSRWSSVVPTGQDGPRDRSKAHGGPGDAQVWQFGLQRESAVFVASIMGFDPAMALPEDRSEEQRRARCSNAQQPIRLKGRDHFSLGDAWSSPKLAYCPLRTSDITGFAIAVEDLFPRKTK